MNEKERAEYARLRAQNLRLKDWSTRPAPTTLAEVLEDLQALRTAIQEVRQ
jgi:hypothetical protein